MFHGNQKCKKIWTKSGEFLKICLNFQISLFPRTFLYVIIIVG